MIQHATSLTEICENSTQALVLYNKCPIIETFQGYKLICM